jgi:FdhD protein
LNARTRAIAVEREPGGPVDDDAAVEEPLEIRVEGQAVAITLRTPGDDLDLVTGFLLTEGVIDGWDDVRAMAAVGENVVDVRLAEGVPAARARSADRSFFASSSCGVCGKASIERLQRAFPRLEPWRPAPAVLAGLPGALRAAQPAFARSGGLHAAALFDEAGVLSEIREDVGRHNAVDKALGARLRRDASPPAGLVVSSRAGFEIVQKAMAARVPCLVALGAPTSLAIEAARAGGMALYCRVRAEGWVVASPEYDGRGFDRD